MLTNKRSLNCFMGLSSESTNNPNEAALPVFSKLENLSKISSIIWQRNQFTWPLKERGTPNFHYRFTLATFLQETHKTTNLTLNNEGVR